MVKSDAAWTIDFFSVIIPRLCLSWNLEQARLTRERLEKIISKAFLPRFIEPAGIVHTLLISQGNSLTKEVDRAR